ncbi:MAG: cytochrome c [Methylococcales bacterium]
MNYQQLINVFALTLLSIPLCQAAGDAAKGKEISGACSSCHGAYGISKSESYPNLAGQHQGYIIKALQQYQSGQRSDPTMQAEVGPLSAQDIENLAAYYSGNAIIPTYATDTKLLHIPYIEVAAEFFQGDLLFLHDTSFELTTIKPLK